MRKSPGLSGPSGRVTGILPNKTFETSDAEWGLRQWVSDLRRSIHGKQCLMESIRFKDLKTDSSGFSLVAELNQKEEYPLSFRASEPIDIRPTDIAVAMSTLVGRAYSKLTLDFAVEDADLRFIEDFTKSEVQPATVETSSRVDWADRNGSILSFSGGFDSLAARALMPPSTKLVSLDFGGRFARERKFFSRYNPLTIETNLTSTPLRKNSWTFMGIGAMLSARSFKSRFHTFGSVLEAGPGNFAKFSKGGLAATPSPIAARGMRSANCVLGLSEVGTLMVILQSDLPVLNDALISVASPGEEKLLRKAVLARAVAERMGMDVKLPELTFPTKPHFAFGEVFAVDVIALYVAWVLGKEVAGTLVRELPDKAVQAVAASGLDFLERWNPDMYMNFPSELYPDLVQTLAKFSLLPYGEKEWAQLESFRALIRRHVPGS